MTTKHIFKYIAVLLLVTFGGLMPQKTNAQMAGEKGLSLGCCVTYYTNAEITTKFDDMKSLGVKWVRVDVPWDIIQPTNASTFDWAATDSAIQLLLARGIQPILIIDGLPSWANSLVNSWGSTTDPNTFPGAYGIYAGKVAQHFGAMGVHTYEIWNEPNTASWPGGTPDAHHYTQMLKAAYPAVKANDPSAFVLGGSFAGGLDALDFLTTMYADGAKAYFDALSDHSYSFPDMPSVYQPWNPWSIMSQTSPSIRSIMTANGDSAKKVWITEYGAPTSGTDRSNVTEAVQAQMVTEAYQLAKSYSWAGPLLWYSYKDNGTNTNTVENFFGLLRYDSTQKPAYAAFKAVANPTTPASGGVVTPVVTNPGAGAAVQLGTYVGIPGNTGTDSQWNEFTTAVGQKPTIMLAYTDSASSWTDIGGYSSWVTSWFNGSATPYLSGVTPEWDIYTVYSGPGSKQQQWQDVASGKYDNQVATAIQSFKNKGFTKMYLRIGSEFNGNWSADYVSSAADAQLFVAAWRRIAQAAHSVSGIQVVTEWNPNNGAIVGVSATYPGDSYVDMVGLDIYSYGGTAPTDPGSDTNVTPMYLANFAKAHGKPFSLPETGGLDAAWVSGLGTELAQLKNSGVVLDHISLWDPLPDASGNLDWTQGSHNDVIQAWRGAIQAISSVSNSAPTPTPTPTPTLSPFPTPSPFPVPTPTPTSPSPTLIPSQFPTNTGSPTTAAIVVNPPTISAGQPATLTWSSVQATSCSGINFTPTGTSGSVSVNPMQTTTYTVTCGQGTWSTTLTVLGTTPSTNPTPSPMPLPTPSPSPSSTPTPTPQSSPSGFAIGVRVITFDILRVRSAPSLTGTIFGTEDMGAGGTIIDGPQTGNGHTWFKIQYDNGLTGWSAQEYLTPTFSTLPTPSSTPVPGPTPTPGPVGVGSAASMSDRFVDSIGVNAHFSFGDTAWGSKRDSLIIPGLEQIGIRHIRDMLTPDSSYEDVINRVKADTGTRIGFDLVLNYPKNIGCSLSNIDVSSMVGSLPAANIDSFEGINEWDGFSKNAGLGCGGDWTNDLRVSQQALYQTVKGNPQYASIPVLGPALSYWGSLPDLTARAQSVGNLSQYMDYSAEHSYPGDQRPSVIVADYHTAIAPMIGGKPYQVTESGYHTDLGGSQGISELAQGKYLSRFYLENFNLGAARTFDYDLYNDGDGTCGGECQFGLMRNDGSLKPGAVAIKNEIAILKDPGPTFSTGTLNYNISGPTQVHHTLLQKRDGTMYLVLWQEVDSFTGGHDANVASVPVSVTFGQTFATLNQYDPLTSASPISTKNNISSLTLQVGDQVTILELKQGSVATTPTQTSNPGPVPTPAPNPTLSGPPAGYNWVQTFGDNFTSLNATDSGTGSLWQTSYYYGARDGGGSNQYWLDPSVCNLGLSPFSISGGVLDIHMQSTDQRLHGCGINQPYTQGILTSYHSFSQTYGYFETRAKVSNAYGTIFAFWGIPEDGSWPPEIDFPEVLGRQSSTDFVTVHTMQSGSHTQTQFTSSGTDLSAAFHTYGMMWTPTIITFYLDGSAVGSTPTPSDLHSPLYLILNGQIGSCGDGWGDCPEHSPSWNGALSADQQVDYVRAWQTTDQHPAQCKGDCSQ